MTVRIGVIGLGAMGAAHAQALSEMPGVEVAWVCDADRRVLDAAMERLGLTKGTIDYREMLGSDAHAVVVATPEAAHADPALLFLRDGKHLLIEKPLTTDLCEARSIVDEAERRGRIVMPGMNLRYEPRFRMVRDWIADGRSGAIVSMYFRRNRPQPLFERYARVHPGFETGSHDVDLAIWYLQDRVRKVYAVQRQREDDENPYGLWAIAEFERGTVACFETVWMIPGEAKLDRDDVAEIVGKHGTARIDISAPGIVFADRSGRYSQDPIYDASSLSGVSLSLAFELQEFVAAVAGREDTVFSLPDALHGVEVIEAMIASAESGEPVAVDAGVAAAHGSARERAR